MTHPEDLGGAGGYHRKSSIQPRRASCTNAAAALQHALEMLKNRLTHTHLIILSLWHKRALCIGVIQAAVLSLVVAEAAVLSVQVCGCTAAPRFRVGNCHLRHRRQHAPSGGTMPCHTSRNAAASCGSHCSGSMDLTATGCNTQPAAGWHHLCSHLSQAL
jgi:hypothetical protein